MAHILLSEIVSGFIQEEKPKKPLGKLKVKVSKKEGPGAWNTIGAYDFAEFVEKYSKDDPDYLKNLEQWKKKHALRLTGDREYIGGGHPLKDLIYNVEKLLNGGITADEAQMLYPRQGLHNKPVYRVSLQY